LTYLKELSKHNYFKSMFDKYNNNAKKIRKLINIITPCSCEQLYMLFKIYVMVAVQNCTCYCYRQVLPVTTIVV